MKKIAMVFVLILCLVLTSVPAFADGRQTNTEYEYQYNLPASLFDSDEETAAAVNQTLSSLSFSTYSNDQEMGLNVKLAGTDVLTAAAQSAEDAVYVIVNGQAFGFRSGEANQAIDNMIDALVVMGVLDEEQATEAKTAVDANLEKIQSEDGEASLVPSIDLSGLDLDGVATAVMTEIFGNYSSTQPEEPAVLVDEEAEAIYADHFASLVPEDSVLLSGMDLFCASEDNTVTGISELALGTESIIKIYDAVIAAIPAEQLPADVELPSGDAIAAYGPELYVCFGTNANDDLVYVDVYLSLTAESTDDAAAETATIEFELTKGNGGVQFNAFDFSVYYNESEVFDVYGAGMSLDMEKAGYIVVNSGSETLTALNGYSASAENEDGSSTTFGNSGIDLSAFGIGYISETHEMTETMDGEDPSAAGTADLYVGDADVMTVSYNRSTGDPMLTDVADAIYPAEATAEEIANVFAVILQSFSAIAG